MSHSEFCDSQVDSILPCNCERAEVKKTSPLERFLGPKETRLKATFPAWPDLSIIHPGHDRHFRSCAPEDISGLLSLVRAQARVIEALEAWDGERAKQDPANDYQRAEEIAEAKEALTLAMSASKK